MIGVHKSPPYISSAASGRGVGRDLWSEPVHGEVPGGTEGQDGVRARTPPHWSCTGSPGTRPPHITQCCPRPCRSSPPHPSTTPRPWTSGHPPLHPNEAHRPGIGNNFTSDDSDIILSGDLGHRKAATARPRVWAAPAPRPCPHQATSPSSAQVTYLLDSHIFIYYWPFVSRASSARSVSSGVTPSARSACRPLAASPSRWTSLSLLSSSLYLLLTQATRACSVSYRPSSTQLPSTPAPAAATGQRFFTRIFDSFYPSSSHIYLIQLVPSSSQVLMWSSACPIHLHPFHPLVCRC